MLKTKQGIINKIHLIVSVLIVVPTAFIYGFKPDMSFDMFLETIDEHNFYKAIMGLYLGFSSLWILGIFKSSYLNTALISHVVFMLGLGFGRLVSIAFDGMPTVGYSSGTIGELILGGYGIWVLQRLKTQQ